MMVWLWFTLWQYRRLNSVSYGGMISWRQIGNNPEGNWHGPIEVCIFQRVKTRRISGYLGSNSKFETGTPPCWITKYKSEQSQVELLSRSFENTLVLTPNHPKPLRLGSPDSLVSFRAKITQSSSMWSVNVFRLPRKNWQHPHSERHGVGEVGW